MLVERHCRIFSGVKQEIRGVVREKSSASARGTDDHGNWMAAWRSPENTVLRLDGANAQNEVGPWSVRTGAPANS